MKSYSVKSNAKRFARGIAAKSEVALEAIEPVESPIAGMGWFPAVAIKAVACTESARQRIAIENPDVIVFWKESKIHPMDLVTARFQAAKDCGAIEDFEIVGGEDDGSVNVEFKVAPALKKVDIKLPAGESPYIQQVGRGTREATDNIDVRNYGARGSIFDNQKADDEDASGLKAAFDAVEPAGDVAWSTGTGRKIDGPSDAVEALIQGEEVTAHMVVTGKQIREQMEREKATPIKELAASVDGGGVSAEVCTPPTTQELAKLLPPPTKSTPEEIAARRAERRQKIDADKQAGTFGKKVEKINKKKIILDLIRREDGATQSELETATGWQRHTLRGYIAGTLRKLLAPLGKQIECERGRGETPTRYVMVDLAAAAGKRFD